MKRHVVILIVGAGLLSAAAIHSFASTMADVDVVIVSEDQSCQITPVTEALVPRDLVVSAVEFEPIDVSVFGVYPDMVFIGSRYTCVVHVEPRCRSPGDNDLELAVKQYPEPELI